MSTAMGEERPPGRAGASDPTTEEPPAPVSADRSRQHLLIEQKSQFGGMKVGSAFFGWLTATGTAVILIALLGAAGTVAGMPDQVKDITSQTKTQTVGVGGAIALLAILLVAYFCGGYVAGRMARFNGLTQGLAVWLWAVLIAVAVAVLGLVAGDKYNVTDQLNNFPNIPIRHDELTRDGVIALMAIAATSLLAALLGGLAGMAYHRRVDRAGFASD